MNNGLYNGLDNGLHNGLYNGTDNGLHNGLFGNETGWYDKEVVRYLAHDALGGLLDYERIAAINLVRRLKLNNLWRPTKPFYPFLGNNTKGCGLNLKNPENKASSFGIDFTGGWTFNGYGIKGNGTNNVGNTNFTPSIHSNGISNKSYGIYLRDNLDSLTAVYGVNDGGGNGDQLFPRYGNTVYPSISSAPATGANTNSIGMYISNKKNTSTGICYKNASSIATISASVYNPPIPMYIGCRLLGGVSSYSPHTLGLFFIDDGLSASEVTIMNSICLNFLTDCKRL